MSKKQIDLSRRKLIAGLGTAGVAAAGAGLGTTAYLNDEESFEGNSITAGTLDMEVSAELVAANNYWAEQVELPVDLGTSDGGVEGALSVSDIKPGDWGIVCFTVDINSNPGYVTIHAKNFSDGENGIEEPEGDVDETSDDGELDEQLLISYWENYDGSGDRSGLSGLDNITNAASNQFYSGNWQQPEEGGTVTGQSDPPVEYTNVREFYYGNNGDASTKPSSNDPLGAGFASGDGILVGGVSDPVQVGATDNVDRRRLSDPDEDGESELEFCLLLELPAEVGNEIQGDSVGFDLVFNTEQVRNNDDARSGRWDGYNTTQSQ